MQIIEFPKKSEWGRIAERPKKQQEEIISSVRKIFSAVENNRDKALAGFTEKFDRVRLDNFSVSNEEIRQAEVLVPEKLREAINAAKRNIEKFHQPAAGLSDTVETMPGVKLWRRKRAIQKVGIYIPGGTAPLFSSVLMLAVPAKLAGCSEIVMCTPPRKDGSIDPAILFAAKISGVTRIFKLGGAQAIAAMTIGTESVPRVYKIFGPGNRWVTQAKLLATEYGVAIDMPAGPSEVAVLADEGADADFVAIDLLSQAEHGVDSQVILATDSRNFLQKTMLCLEREVLQLPRQEIIRAALGESKAILFSSIEEGLEFLETYAPEHLILATRNAEELAERVNNAGSVFVGDYSFESAGDYASGTNHTLPTGGAARGFSGVSVSSFLREVTFQQISPEGAVNIAPIVSEMAEAEGLRAHARAALYRKEKVLAKQENQTD
jgi:histidinol dehydrogenase